MLPGPVIRLPCYARLRRWQLAIAFVAVGLCCGAAGLSWNRTRSPHVTIEDATRIFQVSRDPAEREQCLGAIARRCRELVGLLKDEVRHGEAALSQQARTHLDNLAKMAAR